MPTRVPTVIDAILAVVNAAASDAVGVYDGPYVTGSSVDAIHIGYDANPDGDGEAAASDQQWAGLGAKARDETCAVTCAVHLLRGDLNVKAARDSAYALLALVEGAIHPAPAMGLAPPIQAGITSHRLVYVPSDAGLEVWLPFVITVRTRV